MKILFFTDCSKSELRKFWQMQNVHLLQVHMQRNRAWGYMAIVVNLTKISLLGASAVLQVKAWGGGILCFLQKSVGEMLCSCLTSCRSDFAATIKQGILLSIKCCLKILAQYSKDLGLVTSYTRHTTSQMVSASVRNSDSEISCSL